MSESLLTGIIGGLFGALIGSFLNVCILRWPRGESVIHPRSRCPGCEQSIAWYDNIPVLSWLLLRGRCRRCKTRISIQYLMIELVTGIIWALVAVRSGVSLASVEESVFLTLLLGIALTDARDFIIPHEFTFGGMALGLGFGFLSGGGSWSNALYGAGFGAGLLILIQVLGRFAFRKEAMGGGDVAMVALVGCYLGWVSVLATVFLGAVVGLLVELARFVIVPAPAPDLARHPKEVTLEMARSPTDKFFIAALSVVFLLSIFLSSADGISVIGGMLVGLGIGYLLFGCFEFIRPSRLEEKHATILFAVAGIAGMLVPVLHGSFTEGVAALFAVVLCSRLLIASSIPAGERAEKPPAHPMDELSTDDLRRMKYLPFGVSLAIAAAVIAVLTDPGTITEWLATYAFGPQ